MKAGTGQSIHNKGRPKVSEDARMCFPSQAREEPTLNSGQFAFLLHVLCPVQSMLLLFMSLACGTVLQNFSELIRQCRNTVHFTEKKIDISDFS